MIFCIVRITLIGCVVWGHHQFTVALDLDTRQYFSRSTMVISVPTGSKVFRWVRSFSLTEHVGGFYFIFIFTVFVIVFLVEALLFCKWWDMRVTDDWSIRVIVEHLISRRLPLYPLHRRAVYPVKKCYTFNKWVRMLFNDSEISHGGLFRQDPDLLMWLSAIWGHYQNECSSLAYTGVRDLGCHLQGLYILDSFLISKGVIFKL